jgi:hypothetical protein
MQHNSAATGLPKRTSRTFVAFTRRRAVLRDTTVDREWQDCIQFQIQCRVVKLNTQVTRLALQTAVFWLTSVFWLAVLA